MSEPEPFQQVARTYVRWRGRQLAYFAGCDYFRLASHPKVLGALAAGRKKYGLNVAASRLTTGNHCVQPLPSRFLHVAATRNFQLGIGVFDPALR